MFQQRRSAARASPPSGPAAPAAPAAPPSRKELPPRPDLTSPTGPSALLACRPQIRVEVPSFAAAAPPPPPAGTAAGGTAASTAAAVVPQLEPELIRRVKAAARARLDGAVLQRYEQTRRPGAQFEHPAAGFAGPLELALMRQRVEEKSALQTAARDSLLKGYFVKPKTYEGGWSTPKDCPPKGFEPHPIAEVWIGYQGVSKGGAPKCPENYPPAAPKEQCQHVAFVELDAQMAYKQAVAFYATGNTDHLDTAQRILRAWPATNRSFGDPNANAPLEGAWGGAAMCRAMELLRHSGWQGYDDAVFVKFVEWFASKLLPQMDAFAGKPNENKNNWHASIADAYMSFGLLTDDRGRVERAVELGSATIKSYLRLGGGRTLESGRDQYHVQFGLGSLLQVAEAAFVVLDKDDLYAAERHGLAAAMELHARINNAAAHGRNAAALPPGYKFEEKLPAVPAGANPWYFDLGLQQWLAKDNRGTVVSSLPSDPLRVTGTGFLPCGWELGFNHYVGRLGMALPETARLLSDNWPEWAEFHWGLGSLLAADTASALWRPGEAAGCQPPAS